MGSDWLHNLQDPVQNGNARLLVPKLSRIASHSRALKQTWDLSECEPGKATQVTCPLCQPKVEDSVSCSKEPSAQGLWLHLHQGCLLLL